MRAAAEKKLPEVEAQKRAEAEAKGEEFKTHAELKAEEEALWQKKHETQTDFADAIKDGNPDCSEYASLSAISLEQSGIPNLRVMGHTTDDSKYASVGAHAYNVILDQSGQNIVGVFEGTATSGAFRQVMNDVSLTEFEAGKTLVTFNEEAGWSTYGTGSPAKGQSLQDYKTQKTIERHDTALIAETKMDHLRELKPEAMADNLIEIYEQYGERLKVQGWLDLIRDDGNPAFAQAAQLLHDYQGEMPPPEELRQQVIDIVSETKARGLENQDFEIAITEQDIFGLDDTGATYLGDELKTVFDKLQDVDPSRLAEFQQENPWLTEAMDLMKGKSSWGDALKENTDIVLNRTDATESPNYEAHSRLQDIVRNNDISMDALEKLRDIAYSPEAYAPNLNAGPV